MIESNADLSRLNTFCLQCTASQFGRFSSVAELLELWRASEASNLPMLPLGRGSNVLCPEHVEALIVQSAMTNVRLQRSTEQHAYVAVDAGVCWHDWVVASREYGFGLENLALIPGTVGAAPVQNIGAYGVEVGELIESVEFFQPSTGQLRRLNASECRFGYRDSIFKRELAGDAIIYRVVFRLERQFAPELSYGPLKELEDGLRSGQLTPAALVERVVEIRASKLPDPDKTPNVGSFFKNPVVPAALANQLQQQYPTMPVYPLADPEHCKLAAGWLIDQAGWKGKWLGPVAMHCQQALVMVSDGSASLADVWKLAAAVQDSVRQQFAVMLEPEPQLFGSYSRS
nr:UDP-N-acetylmuramate dehydrogenase [Oceanobacter mangrovi]